MTVSCDAVSCTALGLTWLGHGGGNEERTGTEKLGSDGMCPPVAMHWQPGSLAQHIELSDGSGQLVSGVCVSLSREAVSVCILQERWPVLDAFCTHSSTSIFEPGEGSLDMRHWVLDMAVRMSTTHRTLSTRYNVNSTRLDQPIGVALPQHIWSVCWSSSTQCLKLGSWYLTQPGFSVAT